MPIDISRFRNVCDIGDVSVNARKLTEVQARHLFAVIGRVIVCGCRLTRTQFEFTANTAVLEETPSIDVMSLGSSAFITIYRRESDKAKTAAYHIAEEGHDIIDIFLPQAEYDVLIERINAG